MDVELRDELHEIKQLLKKIIGLLQNIDSELSKTAAEDRNIQLKDNTPIPLIDIDKSKQIELDESWCTCDTTGGWTTCPVHGPKY